MLCAILLATLAAAAPDGGAGASAVPIDEGGFALDADDRGQLIDSSSRDGGARPPPGIPPPLNVQITGALVVPAVAYLDALWLGPQARPDEATAKEVRQQLQAFLQRLGFELATVTTAVTADGIEAQIDEGKIDRIVYLGRLSFPQLRFKVGLVLPYEVFNRPLFERQVEELSQELNIRGVQWELVRTSAVAHESPQFTPQPGEADVTIAGITLLRARRPYEVRISFPEATGSQVGIDLRAYYIDGLELGLNYVANDLLGKGDRWYTAISAGVGLRPRISNDELYPYFSRGAVAARYDTVSIFTYFKPNLWAQASMVDRHRPDLNLESYKAFTVDAAVQLELELRPGLRFLLGGGYEFRRLFGFAAPDPLESLVGTEVVEHNRPFLRATQEWVINPRVLRWDRRHTIESELRHFFPIDVDRGFGWWDLRYRFVKEIGWHDVWVKSRVHLSWGDVTFHDELSAAEFVRGLFVGQWVPSGASLLIEFRYSLVRDFVKLGVFHDLAVFGQPLQDPRALTGLDLGSGFGPSLHLLVFDMFQLDLYLGFGFRRSTATHASFALMLDKAF